MKFNSLSTRFLHSCGQNNMRFFCPKYEFVGLESLKVVRKQVNSCAEKIILNDLASIRFENCKEKTEIHKKAIDFLLEGDLI